MKKIGVLLILVAMVVAGSSCIWPAPLLTADAIADNYAEFFSVQHDREDVKEGRFNLSPWSGDTFEIDAAAALVVKQEDITRKENSGRELTVKTETKYWLEEIHLSPVMIREIKMKKLGETVSVPVKIQIVAARVSISEDFAKALRKMSAEQYRFLVRVKRLRSIDGEDVFHILSGTSLWLLANIKTTEKSENVDALRVLPFMYEYGDIYKPEGIRFVLPVEVIGIDGGTIFWPSS